MDAEQLDFPDAAFVVVVAQYASSPRSPIPRRRWNEFAGCCGPGGEIVITTRIGAEAGLRAR